MDNKSWTSARWFSGSTWRMSRQMLSACVGSFNNRYRSARSSAAGIAPVRRTLSVNSVSYVTLDILRTPSLMRLAGLASTKPKDPKKFSNGVIELVNDALFKGNDRVIGDLDIFGTDRSTT